MIIKNSDVHQVTGVNVAVLFRDAESLRINLNKASVYTLGIACDDRQRDITHAPYPAKGSYQSYNLYRGGVVIGLMVSADQRDELKTINPNCLVETIYDDVGYKEAMRAYNDRAALIRQVFNWGVFYIEGVMDNPKAQKAFSLAWKNGHYAGYTEVANYFDDYVELIK